LIVAAASGRVQFSASGLIHRVTALDLTAGLLGIASIAGILYLAAAAWAVRGFLLTPRPAPGPRPAITILKPLHGCDHELAANLRSFCTQSYPLFQIVFGVAAEEDAAVPTVRALIAELPQADIALVIDGRRHGSNGKVSNLINMLPAAKHDLLVIADSDMTVGDDYLDALAAALSPPGVGIATCLYRGRPAPNRFSYLGAMFINFGFLPSVLVGRLVGSRDGCFGATMALRRGTLAAIGGFEALKDRLADDYELGARVRALGLELVLVPYLVDTRAEEASFRELFAHELRWARTMRSIAPAGYAASVVTLPVPLALLATLLSPAIGGGFLLAAGAARLLAVRAISAMLGIECPPGLLLLVRDLLSFATLIGSFCGSAISWRDQRFQLDKEGRLSAERESKA
jgi:ceramide glucosyltransferase